MSDIFISYSRKDSEQALSLAERLQAQGMSVWIDQQGIEAAKTWSEEIVNAIEESKAFVILLSSHSIESANVAKELSLASECDRRLVPVMIEDVQLPSKFKYQLAGIQRVAYTQHDAITQALVGCGVTVAKAAKQADVRKSLMILPFEDLSPTQDNGWFADGLVSEMIDKLSKIKSLKLVDRQTSLQIKKKGHTIAELSQILEVRYFIEGSIRKFGEQIRISSALLDFETGDYLWQDTHKGIFADIFDIQEAIADKVVAGLKLHLGANEEQEIKKKDTDNAEAYEMFLKGSEEFNKHTRAGYARSIQLCMEAARLDRQYANAFSSIARSHVAFYRTYDRNASHLREAEWAMAEVRRIEGESPRWCWNMSAMSRVIGDISQAESYARHCIEKDPDFAGGYDALAFALIVQQRLAEAAQSRREYVKRQLSPTACFSLLTTLSALGDREDLAATAIKVLPIFEKQVRLNAEDHHTSVWHAIVLYWAGRLDDARIRANELLRVSSIDGVALYNLCCLFVEFNDAPAAIDALRLALARGFSDVDSLLHDTTLDPLREMEEFKLLMAQLETKIAAQQATITIAGEGG